MKDTWWVKLRTYNGLPFQYRKLKNGDRKIEYGSLPFRETISMDIFQGILEKFRGQIVLLGATYDEPPPGSLGDWLVRKLPGRNLAMYVGSILVHEGYAEWTKSDEGICLYFVKRR